MCQVKASVLGCPLKLKAHVLVGKREVVVRDKGQQMRVG